jgi:hypothetical protein
MQLAASNAPRQQHATASCMPWVCTGARLARPATHMRVSNAMLRSMMCHQAGRVGPTCRDRLNVPRGPCSLPTLKEAWVNGVIDGNTLIWGQGLADYIPVKNVRTLVPQIRTVEGEGWRDAAASPWGVTTHAALQRGRRQPSLTALRSSCAACPPLPLTSPPPCLLRRAAVQVATWFKRQFALKPALERARKERGEQRLARTTQVDTML